MRDHEVVEEEAVVASLRAFALSLPEAWLDHPWDEDVVKVRKKIFLFVSSVGAERSVVTVKLPISRDHGLSFAGAHPTGYGLGKHGWVTIFIDGVPDEEHDVLIDFVEESYRSVALKSLVKRLDAEIDEGESPGSVSS
ncbi:MAG: MmcQ/YjbR family DNA-binding protein [Nocardioides sp.]